MEDQDQLRYIEQFKLKKQEEEREKKRMLEQLARDKEERFGKKFDPSTQTSIKKESSVIDDVDYYIKAIRTLYPTFRCGDQAKNCLNTIRLILNNIVKNPDEEKFRKAKTTNPNFEERIWKIQAGMKILEVLGFVHEGQFLVCAKPNMDNFKKSIVSLEKELEKLE